MQIYAGLSPFDGLFKLLSSCQKATHFNLVPDINGLEIKMHMFYVTLISIKHPFILVILIDTTRDRATFGEVASTHVLSLLVS